jgi:hypothetical protein
MMFRKGDIVLITKKVTKDKFTWADDMDKTIGTIGTVTKVSEQGNCLIGQWYYLQESLMFPFPGDKIKQATAIAISELRSKS